MQAWIDHIERNATLDQFLEGFPSMTREQAIRFIEFVHMVTIPVNVIGLLASYSAPNEWRAVKGSAASSRQANSSLCCFMLVSLQHHARPRNRYGSG